MSFFMSFFKQPPPPLPTPEPNGVEIKIRLSEATLAQLVRLAVGVLVGSGVLAAYHTQSTSLPATSSTYSGDLAP